MTGRIQPVRMPWIFVGDHDPNRTIGLCVGSSMIQVNPVVAPVKRLHPVVIQLKVPVIAGRRLQIDHKSFTGINLEVAVVIANVRITMGRAGYRRIEGRQLIGFFCKPL